MQSVKSRIPMTPRERAFSGWLCCAGGARADAKLKGDGLAGRRGEIYSSMKSAATAPVAAGGAEVVGAEVVVVSSEDGTVRVPVGWMVVLK